MFDTGPYAAIEVCYAVAHAPPSTRHGEVAHRKFRDPVARRPWDTTTAAHNGIALSAERWRGRRFAFSVRFFLDCAMVVPRDATAPDPSVTVALSR
jgi:hypothetical protein